MVVVKKALNASVSMKTMD